jgi:parallel beta-helix repeat protein
MRNIPIVLVCVILVFGTCFVLFTQSNANVSLSNTAIASTRTIYVDGNNAGDPSQDGSSSHPFGTIQKGIDNASQGDTVFVRKTHYYETLVISRSVNLVGENRDDTIIDGIGVEYLIRIQSDSVNLNGFTLMHSRTNAIRVEIVDNVSIVNCVVRDNAGYGIVILDSENDSLQGNTVADNQWGISIMRCTNAILRNNSMTGNDYNLDVYGQGNEYIHDIDVSNIVNGKPVQYIVNRRGLTVDPLTFPSVGYLGVVNCTEMTVRGLRLSENGQGILFANTNSSLIENIDVQDNLHGLEIVGSNGNILSGNTVANNTYGGISLYYSSSENTITGNSILRNQGGAGILLYDSCAANTISQNLISENAMGLRLYHSSNNLIYHNNFINNTVQAFDEVNNNFWNKSYPCGGNYWSDYPGSDSHWGEKQDKLGSDMMGDTPYVNGGAMDSYPIMQPWQAAASNFSSIDLGTMSIGTYSIDSSAAVITSSLTTNLGFDNSTGEWSVRFNVTTDTADSCIVIIPKWLLDGTFNVLVDDVSTACWFDWSNQYHMINITYSSGSHHVRISAEYVKRPLLTQLPDLNGDGKVSLQDLTLLAIHYGQHYP